MCLHIGVLILLCTPREGMAQTQMNFHDASTIIMMNSLETLPKEHFLRELYEKLFFVPVWIDEERLSALAEELFEMIVYDKTLSESSRLKEDAKQLLQKAISLYETIAPLKELISLEFQISQLYKGYADYRLYGSIHWEAFQDRLRHLRTKGIQADWVTYAPTYTPVSLLESALLEGSLVKMFHQAEPKEYHFHLLKVKLLEYLALEAKGGWEHLDLKGTLKAGKSYKIIPKLRERLRVSGDYRSCGQEESSYYDACLKEAVVRFQKRHGLVAKGIVGKQTKAALNVPVEHRIRQIRLNLDRIKWLHQRQAKRHIIINIPAFTLFFEEDGSLIQQMRVIVGKRNNPTPIFSNTVQTIVLNPHWNVPKSIIQKEMIPKLLEDTQAMAKEGIEIYSGWGKDAQLVDASSIDWSQYRYSKSMPFRFAQVPGYQNALGKIKFLFPNTFSVYMHDTPNKKLFNRTVRAFSHGCIRLHKPQELLKTFSSFNDNIDFEKSQKRLKGTQKSYLSLDNDVPIDIVYLTAYVDYSGILQFRKDIYGYDKMQLLSYRKW